jgi:hypothetical protein
MKTYLSFSLFFLFAPLYIYPQIIIDNFNDGKATNWVPGSSKITVNPTAGALQVNSAAAGPNYEGFGKTFSPLNMTRHTRITIKVMVPSGSPLLRLRMDVTDNNGFDSNQQPIIITPVADGNYYTYTFDYKGKFKSSYPSVNNLNPEKIVRVYLFINPGQSAFTGSFYLDDIILENAQDKNIVPLGSEWKYLDDGTDPGSTWKDASFDDSGWASDTAEFGYGDGDEKTIVSFGGDPANKHITTYFRKTFSFVDTTVFKNIILQLLADDGAVVYLNGDEVYRFNLPSGSVGNATTALNELSDGPEENTTQRVVLPEVLLDSGNNVLAVEVHQASANSSDLSFNLSLTGSTYDLGLIRGPYLQAGTDTSMVIRWRTLQATESRVRYGSSPLSLSSIKDDAALVTEHEILLTGLSPSTRYYYSIGTISDTLSGADDDHYFITSPPAGTEQPIRIWVTGDAGKGNMDQRSVRDAYMNYMGSNHTDVWLLLGDNAYNEGTDEEYQLAMFEDMFEEQMKNTVIWPAPGNHDLRSYMSSVQQAPYYQIFTVPVNGEAGGMPSGTEAYYSYDYGNIHFISLDSYGTPRDSTAAMAAWLKNDLASTDQKWIIAYWHHPPYSKGSHDSDNQSEPESQKMIEMRRMIIPLLEQRGVDLVLTGHSHNYERSFLIHGFYCFSSEFLDQPHIINGQSSGKRSDGEEYYKNPEHAQHADKGAVYSVVGCSGLKTNSPKWNNQAGNLITNALMYTSTNQYLGSMVIEVHKDTLTARFIDNQGNQRDDFTIIKDAAKEITLVKANSTSILSPTLLNNTLTIFPNPTSGKIAVKYSTENNSKVEIDLLNENGRKLRTLFSGKENKGEYYHEFDFRPDEKGVMILLIRCGKETVSRKVIRN